MDISKILNLYRGVHIKDINHLNSKVYIPLIQPKLIRFKYTQLFNPSNVIQVSIHIYKNVHPLKKQSNRVLCLSPRDKTCIEIQRGKIFMQHKEIEYN